MDWKQIDRWHLQSNTGHRISKSLNNGKALYEAWPDKAQTDTQMLDVFENLNDAKQRCETHHNNKTTKE